MEIELKSITADDKDVKKDIETVLLENRDWISAEDINDPSTFTLENVTRYDVDGHFAKLMGKPTFIEYGISRSIDDSKYPYRIHDFLMMPVSDKAKLLELIDSMIDVFDLFVFDNDMINRHNVYGKLSTESENKIIFVNKL